MAKTLRVPEKVEHTSLFLKNVKTLSREKFARWAKHLGFKNNEFFDILIANIERDYEGNIQKRTLTKPTRLPKKKTKSKSGHGDLRVRVE